MLMPGSLSDRQHLCGMTCANRCCQDASHWRYKRHAGRELASGRVPADGERGGTGRLRRRDSIVGRTTRVTQTSKDAWVEEEEEQLVVYRTKVAGTERITSRSPGLEATRLM